MAISDAPSFRDIVAGHARLRPHSLYVHCVEQEKGMRYGELAASADRVAAYLAAMGLRANDRVLLIAGNSVEFHAVFVGVLRYGATVATANYEMNQSHLAEILAAVAPKLVLYEAGSGVETMAAGRTEPWMELGEWRPNAPGGGFFAAIADCKGGEAVASVAGPDDHAVIFYTSGTVAKPKGVIQTHAAAYYNYDATADYLGLAPGVKVFDCRSFSWLSAQHMALGAPLVAGASAVIARKFSHSRYFDWLKHHEINIGFVVPTMVNMLVTTPHAVRAADLPHLRFLTSSSAPLLLEQWRAFEALYGITLCQSAGSSEGGNTAAHRGADRKFGTIGRPLKHQRLRLLAEDGREVAPGEIGEIIVGGGRQQAVGYLGADGVLEPLPRDGHRSGDLGRIDEDGHLIIVGRKKDLIIRGGVNISPLEIDEILNGIAGVTEAAAAGVPDPIYGEEVAAFVVLAAREAATREAGAITRDAILDTCARRLPAFKMPKEIVFLDELPRNARGKVDRNALIALWNSRSCAEGAAAPV